MQLQAVDLVRGDTPLPMLPDIYQRFNERLDDPHAKAGDFAEIISTDPALTLKLLKVVNSAYYSFRAEITSISQAITIIGLQELREMVLAICVLEYFDGLPNTLMTMKQFWKHSMLTALLARELQKSPQIKTAEPIFTIGLLHDIGTLLLFNRLPEISRAILEREQREDVCRYKIEQETLGFDHAAVSAELIKHWGLPVILSEVSGAHHQPEKAVHFLEETRLLHLADQIAYRLGDTDWSAAEVADEFQRNASEIGLDDIQRAIERTLEQMESVMGQFYH